MNLEGDDHRRFMAKRRAWCSRRFPAPGPCLRRQGGDGAWTARAHCPVPGTLPRCPCALRRRQASGVVKLADFGTAKHVTTLSLQNAPMAGTPAYMSPELIMGNVTLKGAARLVPL